MLMADGYPKKTLKKPSRPHPCSMLRTPGMTIGQGQQGLDAMGQALTRILKKLDDELILTAQNWAQIYPNLIFMGLVSRKQMKTDQKPWSVSHVSHNLCLRLMKKWALGPWGPWHRQTHAPWRNRSSWPSDAKLAPQRRHFRIGRASATGLAMDTRKICSSFWGLAPKCCCLSFLAKFCEEVKSHTPRIGLGSRGPEPASKVISNSWPSLKVVG